MARIRSVMEPESWIVEPLWKEWTEIYAELCDRADGEALVYIGPYTRKVPEHLEELVRRGLVFPYLTTRPYARYAYLPYFKPPPDRKAGDLPAPSLQNRTIKLMYAARDGWTCHLCGRAITRAYNRQDFWFSPDHLVPRSKGGTDYPSNIAASHVTCNKARRDMPIDEARAVCRARLRRRS